MVPGRRDVANIVTRVFLHEPYISAECASLADAHLRSRREVALGLISRTKHLAESGPWMGQIPSSFEHLLVVHFSISGCCIGHPLRESMCCEKHIAASQQGFCWNSPEDCLCWSSS
jgi:hypothetical protein